MDPTTNRGFRSEKTAAALLGALGATLTYTACVLAHLPTPRYFPLARTWDWGPHAGSIAMGYYGNLMVSAAVLAIAYAVGRVPAVGRWLSRPGPAKVLSWLVPSTVAVCLAAQLVYELVRWG